MLPVFQECLFCARKYSWLCALHPSRAKWSTLSDLASRGGRSMWNWDSMGEGGTCLVPSIAISSSLLYLAGCLFTTVWQEALSLCQLISHFSINIWSDPSSFECLFILKKCLLLPKGGWSYKEFMWEDHQVSRNAKGCLTFITHVSCPASWLPDSSSSWPHPRCLHPSICNLGSYS